MRSPYTVLGVDKTAKAEDLKSAYRQLAKTWHPDQNRGDLQAGERFAEIAHAYKLLIDPELRLKFDTGQIDARGRRTTRPVRGFAANPFKAFKQAMSGDTGPAGGSDPAMDADAASFEDMVVHIFGEAAAKQSKEKATQEQGQSRRRAEAHAPGMDEDPLGVLDALFAQWKTRQKPTPGMPPRRHQVDISLEEALAGYRGEITFGNGEAAAFTTAPGITDGTEVLIPSPDPSSCGDALVTIRHRPHPRFRCAGADLHCDHAVDLAEAVLGGSFILQCLDGPVRIGIPEWSGSDTVLRVPDRGLSTANGDRGALHVHLRVMLPEKPDPDLIDLMRSSRRAWFV